MLDQKICRFCVKRQRDKWIEINWYSEGYFEKYDDSWVDVAFNGLGFFYCNRKQIFVDKDPPEHCPYVLEHLMACQEKK